MNNTRLEDRIRRSFSEPAPHVDSERLLADVRRGAARRSTRRRTALAAAALVLAAGSAVALHGLTWPQGTVVGPSGHDRHGTVSGYWQVDTDHAVRVTQERCGQQWCSRIWTGNGGRDWRPATTVRWRGREGDGMASGPVSLVQLAPDGRGGWAWGDETWATHDGGASWQRVPAPSLQGAPVQHLATTVTPDGQAWALARPMSRLLFTADPGSTRWRPVTLPPNVREVSEVVGTARRTAVLAQTRTGAQRLIVSSDGLRTSSTGSLPCPAMATNGLTADREAFFTACARTSRDQAEIWSSVDGRQWQRLAVLPRRGLVGALTGVDARSLLVTVDQATPPFPTFLVSPSGAARVTLGPGRGLPVSSQFIGQTGTLIIDVAGRHTALVRTHDGGHTWQAVYPSG
jgi:photosystem II stability/assembly factor-like uncharacterized protein